MEVKDSELKPRQICRSCLYAKVGKSEICYCDTGRWDNRKLENIGKIRTLCADYESMDD